MTIVFLLVVYFFTATRKDFKLEEWKTKISFKTFLTHLCLISFTSLLFISLKTNFSFDVDGLMFYGDHYYYSKIAIGLQENGIETRNLSNAYNGVPLVGAYHYFELYFSALTSLIGLPVLLCYEFVYPIVFIYVVQTLFISNFNASKLFLLIIVSIVLLIKPLIPIHFEYIVNENFIFQKTKLLVPIVFLSLSLTSGNTYFSYLLLCILAIIYPTTLFAIIGVLLYTIVKHFIFNKPNKTLVFQVFTTLFVLTYVFLDHLIPNFREVTKLDVSSNNFSIWLKVFSDSVVYWIRPVLTRDLPYTLIVLFLLFKGFQKKKYDLNITLVIIGLPAAILGASLFFKTIDNEQIFSNFYTSLTVAICVFFLYKYQTKNKAILKVVSFVSIIYLITFQLSIVKRNHYPGPQLLSKSTQAKLLSFVNNNGMHFGSLKHPDQLEGKYFSNTSLNDCGKEIMNFGNNITVNVTPIDNLMLQLAEPSSIELLKKDQFYGCSNNYTNANEVLSEQFVGIFSCYNTNSLAFLNRNSIELTLVDSLYLPHGYSNSDGKVYYYQVLADI